MSMKDTLKKAKIAAMKAKDKAKLNPINLTLADIQNLEIAMVDAEKNLLLVKGAVPGAKGQMITIKKSVKA